MAKWSALFFSTLKKKPQFEKLQADSSWEESEYFIDITLSPGL
jgi:hypothetical protein